MSICTSGKGTCPKNAFLARQSSTVLSLPIDQSMQRFFEVGVCFPQYMNAACFKLVEIVFLAFRKSVHCFCAPINMILCGVPFYAPLFLYFRVNKIVFGTVYDVKTFVVERIFPVISERGTVGLKQDCSRCLANAMHCGGIPFHRRAEADVNVSLACGFTLQPLIELPAVTVRAMRSLYFSSSCSSRTSPCERLRMTTSSDVRRLTCRRSSLHRTRAAPVCSAASYSRKFRPSRVHRPRRRPVFPYMQALY